jgi:hypothetical protein
MSIADIRVTVGQPPTGTCLPGRCASARFEKSPAATLGGGVKVDHEMLGCGLRSALSGSWPDSFCAAIGIPRGSLLNDVRLFSGGKVAAFWKLVEIEIRRPVQLSGAG